MIKVRIYQPTESAMQASLPHSRKWILEYEQTSPSYTEPLMGWTGSDDTKPQVRGHLRFPSKERAIAFAKRNNFTYEVIETNKKKFVPRNYVMNGDKYMVRHLSISERERISDNFLDSIKIK